MLLTGAPAPAIAARAAALGVKQVLVKQVLVKPPTEEQLIAFLNAAKPD